MSESSERYDELFYALRQLSNLPVPARAPECDLLAIAFKNIISPLRASHKTILRRELREKLSGNPDRADLIGNLGNLVKEEFRVRVEEFLEVAGRMRERAEEGRGEVQVRRMEGTLFRCKAAGGDGEACDAEEVPGVLRGRLGARPCAPRDGPDEAGRGDGGGCVLRGGLGGRPPSVRVRTEGGPGGGGADGGADKGGVR
uniref:Uncharacterized protein n=1 Tax=Arcella intermedia TaxID=1963864 RepID=A0A6B2LIF6_9EUKA